jgi:hypothetical protein
MLTLNFAWIGLLIFLGVTAFLIHSGFNINLFVKKDEHIADKFFEKFPLVSPEFMNKNTVEQNIENNQEIHEINIRLYDLAKQIEEIRRTQRGGL